MAPSPPQFVVERRRLVRRGSAVPSRPPHRRVRARRHDAGPSRARRAEAVRQRRSPGFSLLAVLCLTLGIGANAAVFSWIEGILLRPFPLVVDQDRLFAVVSTNRGSFRDDMSWPDWLDLQRSSTLVDAFIAEKITGTTLSVGDRAERAPGSVVSANYFDAIGVRPILGRGFVPDEDVGRNAHPVAVISYQMWQERFHGDAGGTMKAARKSTSLNPSPLPLSRVP